MIEITAAKETHHGMRYTELSLQMFRGCNKKELYYVSIDELPTLIAQAQETLWKHLLSDIDMLEGRE